METICLRQDKTGRLFQANTQSSATGLIVINEKDLTAIDVIRFANSKIPWGMWVDEPTSFIAALQMQILLEL